MVNRATIHGGKKGVWLILIAAPWIVPVDLAASWTVDMSAAAAHLGGPSTYTFATQAEAQAFVNANSNYGARLMPGGSDAIAGGLPAAGAGLAGLPGLTAQQQQAVQAVQAAQAALPLLQNAFQTIFSATPKTQMPLQNQSQDQIAAQQLYNSGVWYMRKKDYANALIEFQKALARSPGNRVIMGRMAEAQRLIDQAADNNAPPNGGAVAPPTASSALNLLDLQPGSDVVDLRSATKTSVDPASLKAGYGRDQGSPVPDTHEADAQFDALYNRMEIERRQEQQQLDADFDKLYNQMEADRRLEQKQLDADFDKLYRGTITTPPPAKGPGAS